MVWLTRPEWINMTAFSVSFSSVNLSLFTVTACVVSCSSSVISIFLICLHNLQGLGLFMLLYRKHVILRRSFNLHCFMDVFWTLSLVCKLYAHQRVTLSIAINQTLPGLEDFLKVVLGSEPLSEEANRQRIDFLRRLESVSRPPSLPPRPANLSEIYRARLQQNEAPSGSGINDESSVYKNDKAIDPVQFASHQRELSRFATLYKTYAPQTVIIGEKGNRNGGLYFARPGNTRVSDEASARQI